MRRVLFGASCAVVFVAVALACGGKTVEGPSYVAQRTDALAEVPFPPPPARVEFVPDKPDDAAVWLDGEWTWRGGRYGWKPGRWVKPPTSARFSPWTTVRDKTGTLYLASGVWRDDKGNELPDPQPIKVGGPSRGTVVTPEGEEMPPAPMQPAADVPLDAGGSDASESADATADAASTTMTPP